MTTTYYASSMPEPALLLRRVAGAGLVDEAYLAGAWQPTKVVVDYMFGHNDFVDEVSEDVARELEPEAVTR